MLSQNNNNSIAFTEKQINVAASWWAQFLPGRKKVTFDEINKHTKIDGENARTMTILHNMMHGKEHHVTDEQYDNFIKILSEKIKEQEVEKGYRNLSYIQLGHSSCYDPPSIVEKAIKEAKIHVAAYGLFPFKTEMRIYSNGQIVVGKEVISVNPAIKHYGKNIDFTHAPLMNLTGAKFRIVEIKLDELHANLLAYYPDKPRQFDINSTLRFKGEPIATHVYAKLYLKDFNGNEQRFLELTNNDLVNILQNPVQLSTHFKNSTFIHYEKNKSQLLREDSFSDLGKIVPEQISYNYYQYSTGPVKVLSAPQDGTIGTYMLTPVSPKDFLIKRENDESVYMVSKNDVGKFKARFCDKEGKILSPKVYKSGDDLPTLKHSHFKINVINKMIGNLFKHLHHSSHDKSENNAHETKKRRFSV